MIGIEKVDYVMARTGASYEEVRAILLQTNGDVDEAIAILEGRSSEKPGEDAYRQGFEDAQNEKKSSFAQAHVEAFLEEITDAIREMWRRGEAARLEISDGQNIIMSLNLSAGPVGLILAPVVGLVGLGASVISTYEFRVIRRDGKVVDVRDWIKSHRR